MEVYSSLQSLYSFISSSTSRADRYLIVDQTKQAPSYLSHVKKGVSKTRTRGRDRGLLFFFFFFNFLFCFFLPFFLLVFFAVFFLYDNNGNNQRLRTNRELRAEYHGMVFNHFFS